MPVALPHGQCKEIALQDLRRAQEWGTGSGVRPPVCKSWVCLGLLYDLGKPFSLMVTVFTFKEWDP